MRNFVVVALLLCLGFSTVTAQEVYNSSGKKNYKKTKKKTGYDPDKLILGGGMNLGFGGGAANVGVSPIVGYRFLKPLSAGVGIGYQYYRYPVYADPNNPDKALYGNMHLVYPSVWTRCVLYRNIYATAAYEFDFINVKEPGYDHYGNFGTQTLNTTNSCLLVGLGLRQPLGGRVSFFGEIVYDVLQGEYTPYPSATIRFGIAAGF